VQASKATCIDRRDRRELGRDENEETNFTGIRQKKDGSIPYSKRKA
jgi:hypothetical protein